MVIYNLYNVLTKLLSYFKYSPLPFTDSHTSHKYTIKKTDICPLCDTFLSAMLKCTSILKSLKKLPPKVSSSEIKASLECADKTVWNQHRRYWLHKSD